MEGGANCLLPPFLFKNLLACCLSDSRGGWYKHSTRSRSRDCNLILAHFFCLVAAAPECYCGSVSQSFTHSLTCGSATAPALSLQSARAHGRFSTRATTGDGSASEECDRYFTQPKKSIKCRTEGSLRKLQSSMINGNLKVYYIAVLDI